MEIRFPKYLNRRLIGTFIALTFIGILNLFSASRAVSYDIFQKQVLLVLLGIAVMAVMVFVDYRFWSRVAYPIYAGALGLLMLVLLAGKVSGGAQRWISFGGQVFQPSELMKLSIIILLAKFFESREVKEGMRFKNLILSGAIVLIPFFLVVLQPDLGTALHTTIGGFAVLLFVGIRVRSLIALSTGAAAIAPAAWFFLKDYQKKRMLSFLNPSMDPLGSGYHIIQSKIAIGSGGIFGKGFLQGTQTQLGFLPEHYTDFIFSTFSEEWGFLGAFIVFALFFIFIITAFDIAVKAKDRFGFLLASGITFFISAQLLINLGMVLGLLPVVGIPLPFFSYGRSSLIILMIECALLINIDLRKRIFTDL
ncbi:MAG TPA: rod shape-determining protein RodA [bacterium]